MAHQRKTKHYRIQLAFGQGSLRDSLERWIRQAAVKISGQPDVKAPGAEHSVSKKNRERKTSLIRLSQPTTL